MRHRIRNNDMRDCVEVECEKIHRGCLALLENSFESVGDQGYV